MKLEPLGLDDCNNPPMVIQLLRTTRTANHLRLRIWHPEHGLITVVFSEEEADIFRHDVESVLTTTQPGKGDNL